MDPRPHSSLARSLAALVFSASLLAGLAARSQAGHDPVKKQPGPPPLIVAAAHLIDGLSGKVLENQAVLVVDGRIAQIGPRAALEKAQPTARVLDLKGATLLPGLIDAHTHVLLQGDITTADYDDQLLKESIPYRILRASVAAKTALEAGFTSIRDLETEGAMYADVDLKRAINAGVVPGPRMWVATRAFAPTGMYPLLGYSWDLKLPEGVQIADGPDNLRRAVREQVKYGADWIKVYVDRKFYKNENEADAQKRPLRSWTNYTDEELKAIVDEAHRIGRKVAAHAMGWDGIDQALRMGMDSIEHGDGITPDLAARMVKQGTYWCPTMWVGLYVAEGRGGIWPELVQLSKKAFQTSRKAGVRIAYGTDAGGYAWTENEAKELAVMVRYGMSPMKAIQSATSVAGALVEGRTENNGKPKPQVGAIEVGRYGDLIAVDRDPLADITALESVKVVIKGGVIVRDELSGK